MGDSGLFGLGNGVFLGVMVLLVLGLALFLHYGRKEAGEEIKSRCTAKTSGRLEYVDRGCYFNGFKMNEHRRGHYMYGPSFVLTSHTIYTYSVDGTSYTGIDARTPLALAKGGNHGDEVEIYYNPNDVMEFYCPNEDRNIIYADLIITGMIAAGAGLFYYLSCCR